MPRKAKGYIARSFGVEALLEEMLKMFRFTTHLTRHKHESGTCIRCKKEGLEILSYERRFKFMRWSLFRAASLDLIRCKMCLKLGHKPKNSEYGFYVIRKTSALMPWVATAAVIGVLGVLLSLGYMSRFSKSPAYAGSAKEKGYLIVRVPQSPSPAYRLVKIVGSSPNAVRLSYGRYIYISLNSAERHLKAVAGRLERSEFNKKEYVSIEKFRGLKVERSFSCAAMKWSCI